MLKAIIQCTHASIGVIFALCLLPMVIFIFGVIDVGVYTLSKQQLEQAGDIGTITAAITFSATDSEAASMEAASRFFHANFSSKTYGAILDGTPGEQFKLTLRQDDIFEFASEASRQSFLEEVFSNSDKLEKIYYNRRSLATFEESYVQLALAIDVTQSMMGTISGEETSNPNLRRINLSKNAIRSLLSKLPQEKNVYVSVVPFTDLTRLANPRDISKFDKIIQGGAKSGWGGCPLSRDGALDVSLTPPDLNDNTSPHNFKPHFGIGQAFLPEVLKNKVNLRDVTIAGNPGSPARTGTRTVCDNKQVWVPAIPEVRAGYYQTISTNCRPETYNIPAVPATPARTEEQWEKELNVGSYHREHWPSTAPSNEDEHVCDNYNDPRKPQIQPIRALTNDIKSIGSYVEDLSPVYSNIKSRYYGWNDWGHTQTHVGLLWAARTLHHDWYSTWGIQDKNFPDAEGKAENVLKFLVLLSDGANTHNGWGGPGSYAQTKDWLGYGGSTFRMATAAIGWRWQEDGIPKSNCDGGACGNLTRELPFNKDGFPLINAQYFGAYQHGLLAHEANDKMKAACSLIKDNKISISTVALNVENAMGSKLLQECASTQNDYYDVENVEALNTAFSKIRKTIQKGLVRFAAQPK
jgi:hypothetical protein